MKFKGKLVGVSRDFYNKKLNMTFETSEDVTAEIDNLKDLDLSIEAKKYSKRRSLDANAYYWKLTTQLAEVNHISKNCQHNFNLRKYGQAELIDGKLVRTPIPDTEKAENIALEAETFHLKPTSQVKQGIDGVMYRTYILLKGSSEYDSKEMSVLIDGIVNDCKELGIETIPPEELERMLRQWKSGK